MDKAEYGSEYTNRKRGQRGGFRDPKLRRMVRDGKISPSALVPNRERNTSTTDGKNNSTYRRLYYAQMETLILYFDEEWFDFEGLISDHYYNIGRIKSAKAKPPLRCTICKNPWCTDEYNTPDYLDESTFKNIPMEEEVCPKCEDVLPAAVG